MTEAELPFKAPPKNKPPADTNGKPTKRRKTST